MREIKFQGFDVRGNRMIDIVGYVIAHNEIRIWYFNDESLVNESFKPSQLILRQFTGLLDKNGKEIFEGDILRDVYGQVGTCHWEPSYWVFVDHGGYVESGKRWEIIGNIHENPDLL